MSDEALSDNGSPPASPGSRLARIAYPVLPMPTRANTSKRRTRLAALIATPPRSSHAERRHELFTRHQGQFLTAGRPPPSSFSTRGPPQDPSSSPTPLTTGRLRLHDALSSGMQGNGSNSAEDRGALPALPPQVPRGPDPQLSRRMSRLALGSTRTSPNQTPATQTPSRFSRPSQAPRATASQDQEPFVAKSSRKELNAVDVYKDAEPKTPPPPSDEEWEQLSPLSPNVEIHRGSARHRHRRRVKCSTHE